VADPTPKARASGFVLVREAPGRLEYLLLTNRGRGELGLPKGHAEPGESDLHTALRETEEETGLTDLTPDPWFSRELVYLARRRGAVYEKTVTYLLARLNAGRVRLSPEHSEARWVGIGEALSLLPFAALSGVVKDAALFLKDPALFAVSPRDERAAELHLKSLPHADERLVLHLKGGARLARAFAQELARAGLPVHVEAAAAGTLLHDVGRALGRHEDHQRAGLVHLRKTDLAPYGFACVSHFTKGASREDLLEAGVAEATVDDFSRLIDGSRLTWEERCAALADACMMGPVATTPAQRFADLRRRYDAPALIDLQERRTAEIRDELEQAARRDPLAAVGLDG
jgi:bis(5'-nucleosidyl)-tetraphosphatase